jgi:hypothetical protein
MMDKLKIPPTEGNVDTGNAKSVIEEIRSEISVMGGNDSEFDELNNILAQLENGSYSPERAVEEARKIRDRKADYH